MDDNTNTTITDPILSNDFTDTKPDDPLVPKNNYVLEIVSVEQKHSERKDSNYLNIQLKSVEPITSVTGEVLPAGKRFFGIIGITPNENYDASKIQRSLKKFMLCFGVTSGSITPFDQWPGKRGNVSIGVSKTTEDYPDPKNEVKGFNLPKN